MFKRLLFLCFLTIGLSEDFSDGPYGSGYFDIAGPFELPDLNMELHGDANIDGIINIQDVILIVGNILGNNDFTEDQSSQADANSDGIIDVLDIVDVVNSILNPQDPLWSFQEQWTGNDSYVFIHYEPSVNYSTALWGSSTKDQLLEISPSNVHYFFISILVSSTWTIKNSIHLLGMTTIVLVRKNNDVVVASDGQVSMGNTVIKSTANKVRKIEKRNVIAGFAGSTADALTLFERLESKLEKHAGNLARAAVELAKDWRTDKYLRRLEALMAVGDKEKSFIISGTGDVLEPEGDVIGIGSGGNYALAAAKVLMDTDLSAEDIAKKSIKVASDICVFTNDNLSMEKI